MGYLHMFELYDIISIIYVYIHWRNIQRQLVANNVYWLGRV